MAEIKSAIELAMEKTRGLVIDSKEREAMAARETEDKVRVVIRRYLEEMIDDEAAAKELNRISADDAVKRALIMDIFVSELDVLGTGDRLLALIHTAGIDFPEHVRKELDALSKAFREEVQNRETVVRERIRNRLGELGVSGRGMEPNLEAWEEWHEEVKHVSDAFKKRMEELKDKLQPTGQTT